jgi:Motility quorum-sensing regulator, toxin of MqsA
VRLTVKALTEARELDLGANDVIDALLALSPTDSAGRMRSTRSSEWRYVFNPMVGETVLYVKVALRDDCVVVSFHKDEGNEEDN